MQADIKYTTTSDGRHIAYAIYGSGPPMMSVVDMPWSHLQYELQYGPYQQEGWKSFLRRRSLVRFDPRGMGLSDRTVDRFGIEEWLLDMEAVVEAAGLQSFALYGQGNGGPLAIAYAARHPDRVTHLILSGTGARPADSFATKQSQVLGEMLTRDYEMFSENVGGLAFGWGRQEGTEFGEFIRACASPEAVRHIYGALRRIDVSGLLPEIKAPTLVVHLPDIKYLTFEMAQELAARIPNAQLSVQPGTYADANRLGGVLRFLGDELSETAGRQAHGMLVILFADIVDSTALTERLGDTPFRDKARDLDTTLRSIIRDAGGTPVEGKLLGDGVLAVFTSARQAIDAALKCGAAGETAGLPLHLGLHAGDVIEEDGNVFGGAVNIAARIASESAPGEVLVSQTVRDLARTSAGVGFEDAGGAGVEGSG